LSGLPSCAWLFAERSEALGRTRILNAVVDTHCHLTSREYDGRLDEILAAARACGVHACVTISTTTADAERCVAVAEDHKGVLATAGIHPLHSADPIDWAQMRRAAEHPRCVAWGELGLDRHYRDPPLDLQRRVLDEQLAHIRQWASEGLDKPVVIHCRDAFADLIPVLASSGLDPSRFVFHCFTAGPMEAKAVLDFGAWISFTGVVSFRNAPQVREAAAMVPDDRIMAETDAPWLSPEPVRTARPNEPRFVTHVARAIAAARGTTYEALEALLDANAERFFGPLVSRGAAT